MEIIQPADLLVQETVQDVSKHCVLPSQSSLPSQGIVNQPTDSSEEADFKDRVLSRFTSAQDAVSHPAGFTSDLPWQLTLTPGVALISEPTTTKITPSKSPVAILPATARQIGSEMVFEHIEKLKKEYTDKYVTVDTTRPELRRFGGMTGTVRTVNMSGRALVEFDAYANIGWYDIDVDFLKVIDAPLPKPEAKKPEAKKAEAKATPKAAPAAKTAAAAKPASGGAMSVADMLAAARGKGGGAAPAAKPSSAAEIMAAARSEKGGAAVPPKTDPKSMSVADMLAAARGEKAGGAAPAAKAAPAAAPKKDPKSMSVAEMLAAARGEKGGAGAVAAVTASEDPKAGVRDMLESARKPKAGAAIEEPPVVEEAPVPDASPAASGDRRNDIKSVADQLAYCRKADAR